MITFRITTQVDENRRVVLTLPAEVPTGKTELVVTVDSLAANEEAPLLASADWVEVQDGRDGKQGTRYPLRGSVLHYERPTDPVGEADWEALR